MFLKAHYCYCQSSSYFDYSWKVLEKIPSPYFITGWKSLCIVLDAYLMAQVIWKYMSVGRDIHSEEWKEYARLNILGCEHHVVIYNRSKVGRNSYCSCMGMVVSRLEKSNIDANCSSRSHKPQVL